MKRCLLGKERQRKEKFVLLLVCDPIPRVVSLRSNVFCHTETPEFRLKHGGGRRGPEVKQGRQDKSWWAGIIMSLDVKNLKKSTHKTELT